jgi:hypothetical protein
MNIADFLPHGWRQLVGASLVILWRILIDYYLGRTNRIRLPSELELISVLILRLWNWKQNRNKGDKHVDP